MSGELWLIWAGCSRNGCSDGRVLDDVLAHEATAYFSLTGRSFGIERLDRLEMCGERVPSLLLSIEDLVFLGRASRFEDPDLGSKARFFPQKVFILFCTCHFIHTPHCAKHGRNLPSLLIRLLSGRFSVYPNPSNI